MGLSQPSPKHSEDVIGEPLGSIVRTVIFDVTSVELLAFVIREVGSTEFQWTFRALFPGGNGKTIMTDPY